MRNSTAKPFVEHYPILREIWNEELNNELGLRLEEMFSKDRNKEIWVNCKDCERTHKRTLGSAVRYNCKLKGAKFIVENEQLMSEWDYEKNEHLSAELIFFTTRSTTQAWWKCKDCGESWETRIATRQKSGCPYCAKIVINEPNSFYALSPYSDFLTEDYIELSKTISKSNKYDLIEIECKVCHDKEQVYPITLNKNEHKICKNCGHNYLSGEKVRKGILGKEAELFKNEFPELVDSLVDSSLAEEKTSYSKCYEWYCNCGSVVKKRVRDFQEQKATISCKKCKVKGSYPERFVHAFLKVNNIEFYQEKVFDWLPTKRYDFYLPDTNTIIEVHGAQHYQPFVASSNGFFGEYELIHKNDIFKETTARENNIDNYIVINASQSVFSFLKKNVLDSLICSVQNIQKNEIDWIEIGKQSLIPPNILAIQYWNSGIHSIQRLCELVKVSLDTMRNYLLKGVELGICDYTKEKSYASLAKRASDRTITCYNIDDNSVVKVFEASSEAYQWAVDNNLTDGTKHNFNKRLRMVLDQERKDGKGHRTYLGFLWKSEKKHL